MMYWRMSGLNARTRRPYSARPFGSAIRAFPPRSRHTTPRAGFPPSRYHPPHGPRKSARYLFATLQCDAISVHDPEGSEIVALDQWHAVIRVLVAAGLMGLLGLERELRGK